MPRGGTIDSDWVNVGIEDLSARLRFNPDDAHIWLENERMLLLHVGAFARLRQDLIEQLGTDKARAILERVGGVSGTRDAAIARRAMPHAGPIEAFKAGPRLHSIEGMVVPEMVRLEVDPESGFHNGEWIWRHSAEAEAHLEAFGRSTEPVCWTLIGYASSYSSAFMGRPIVYRELECKAMGAPQCRIVGKPAALWDDVGGAQTHVAIDLGEWIDPARASEDAIALDVRLGSRSPRDLLTGASPEFSSMLHNARRYAAIDAPVLLLGEPGAGKKSIGRAIHALSARHGRRLATVNCAAFDDEALEIELFGRDRTLAEPARQGAMERANGGSVLIEDIQAMPPRCQAKLLHVLRNGELYRRGEFTPRPVNVRVIACGNQALLAAARKGEFRQDLYFQLSICPISVPPLRERKADLPVLMRHFVEKFADRYQKDVRGISMAGVNHLLIHDFPGNVAELESMIERAVISIAGGGVIGTPELVSPTDLNDQTYLQLSRQGLLVPHDLPRSRDESRTAVHEQLVRGDFDLLDFETDLIRFAVRQSDGNLARAAKLLGLTRPQLAYRYAKIAGEEAVPETGEATDR